MKLKTDRLNLREFRKQDAKNLVELLNNLNVSQWMLVYPHPFIIKDANDLIKAAIKNSLEKNRKNYYLGIELKEDKKLIGGIGLVRVDSLQGKAMVLYWLGQEYHGNGYGSEALESILNFSFKNLKLRRIEAGVYPGNPSSGKLLEKFGFQKEGYEREAYVCRADNKIKDKVCYGLLKKDYAGEK